MLNKSINLQKEIRFEDRSIAYINSQISVGYGMINFSIQVIDKDYVSNNPQVLREEYDLFMQEIKNEAMDNGWVALKEPEIIESTEDEVIGGDSEIDDGTVEVPIESTEEEIIEEI